MERQPSLLGVLPLGAVLGAPSQGSCPPVAALLCLLQDLYVLQLLLQTVNVLNDLFDAVTVPVDLVLESLNRLKPSSESAGLSGSLEHRGLQQRLGRVFPSSNLATWAQPVCAPSP